MENDAGEGAGLRSSYSGILEDIAPYSQYGRDLPDSRRNLFRETVEEKPDKLCPGCHQAIQHQHSSWNRDKGQIIEVVALRDSVNEFDDAIDDAFRGSKDQHVA